MSQTRSHRSLLEIIQSIGYLTEGKGLCHGLGRMWMQALLVGEEQLFIDRCERIFTTPNLKDKIQSAKNNVKKKQPLSDEDKAMFDILVFVDGMELYHLPHEHHDVFDQSIYQADVELISRLAASKKLEERGGVVRLYSEPVICDEGELVRYLSDLEKVLIANSEINKEENQIDILLSSHNHAISLQYNVKTKTWRLIDANQLECINQQMSMNEIAKSIMYGLTIESLPQPTTSIAFNLSLFTTKANPAIDELNKRLRSFKASHDIPKEIIDRKAEAWVTLAYIAAKFGHADVVDTLARHGMNMDATAGQRYVPLLVAAENGHTSVVNVLADNHTDLNIKNHKGFTAAHYAALACRPNLITVLADRGADLNAVDIKGATPANTAARKDHLEVIQALVECGADLTLPTRYWHTPARTAAHFEHWRTAAFILANISPTSELDPKEIALFTGEKRPELVKGLIALLHDEKQDYRRLAQDVIDGKNMLGQILNTFSVPFSSFFVGIKYKGRNVTSSIDQIAKALDAMQPPQQNKPQ